jgi:hypothetical protein
VTGLVMFTAGQKQRQRVAEGGPISSTRFEVTTAVFMKSFKFLGLPSATTLVSCSVYGGGMILRNVG